MASRAVTVEGFANIAQVTVVLAILVGLAAFLVRRITPAASRQRRLER
jgi:hypothetical protein